MTAFAISEWAQDYPLEERFYIQLLLLPGRLVAVYVNWFFLIPILLQKNKLKSYLLSLVALLCVTAVAHRFFLVYWAYPFYFHTFYPEVPALSMAKPTLIIGHALAFLIPLVMTTLYRVLEHWSDQRAIAEKLKREKVEAELKFLQFQTNPHFLFNTLNSIYGMALQQSPKTPSYILKLSDILSYTLYEVDTDKIALRKELKLIENIIELEKVRYEKRLNIDYVIDGDIDAIQIPPLILIPFVENAFKHGIENGLSEGWIKISIQATETKLKFTIANSLFKGREAKEGGLGLKNVKQRLSLVYGEAQKLTIEKKESTFHVHLEINLN